MNAAEYFEQNRYVYLAKALQKDDCDRLTSILFDRVKNGQAKHDDQCPKSFSVYGDEELDKILVLLAPDLSNQLGIELIPTYTYARIYQPGEVLERHTDRPSCEISGTLTLGLDPDSEIWPIYFGKDETDPGVPHIIDVGDLMMYRGNELTHWRPAYKGNWQAQVFFHFVDANGPHKEWAFDKDENRIKKFAPNLIEEKQKNKSISLFNPKGVILSPPDDDFPGYSAFHSDFKPELTFTKNECEKIIASTLKKYPSRALVGNSENSRYHKQIRDVDLYNIEYNHETSWIFDKIITAVSIANHEYYQYDITGITHDLQLLHYKSDEFTGHYDWHIDAGPGDSATRKISLSVMLSPESEYEGGNLVINSDGRIINSCKEQGSINMFPSYAPHKVEPVTAGERWALVVWVHGYRRFR